MMAIKSLLPLTVALFAACGDASVGSPASRTAPDTSPGAEDSSTDSGSDSGGSDTVRDDPDVVSDDIEGGPDADTGIGEDTGGTGVRPMNLVVTANGREIGWLMGAGPYSLSIWDPVTDLVFGLNDSTGNVVGGGYFRQVDDVACEPPVSAFEPILERPCSEQPAPRRRYVTAAGGDRFGITEATAILVASTTARPWLSPHELTDEGCEAYVESVTEMFREWCYWPLEPTTEIPTSFDLPIEVRERSLP